MRLASKIKELAEKVSMNAAVGKMIAASIAKCKSSTDKAQFDKALHHLVDMKDLLDKVETECNTLHGMKEKEDEALAKLSNSA